jgi:hypothetical protein
MINTSGDEAIFVITFVCILVQLFSADMEKNNVFVFCL